MKTNLIPLATLMLCLISCGGKKSHSLPPEQIRSNAAAIAYIDALKQGPYDIQIVKELGDQRVALMRDKKTGELLEISGNKNDSGTITELKKITQTTATGTQTTIEFQADGTRSIMVGNETRVDLTKQADGTWLTEFTDLASGTSFRTSLQSTAPPSSTVNQVIETQPRLLAALVTSKNTIVANVRTTNCGQAGDPVGNRVYVQFNDSNNLMLERVTADRVSEGLYRAALPNPVMHAPVSMAFVKESLSTLNSLIDTTCQLDERNPLAAPQ